MQLSDCPLGADVTVTAVDPSCDACLRMHELGLRVGTCVRVTHRGPAGTRVVAVGASRVAVDAQTASRIEVAVS
jgi:ferrous iron transport protein A